MFRIDCECGEALLVASEAMGGTIVCWKCRREHYVPAQRLETSQGGPSEQVRQRGRREGRWLLPVVGSSISIMLIAAVLVWALAAAGGEGGMGDGGQGLGPLDEGDGSGAGLSGEGSGEGTTGTGTTGDPGAAAEASESGAEGSDSASDGPPGNTPASPPAPRRRIETDLSEIAEPVPPVPPPPPPPPPVASTSDGGDPGREGAAGGGAGGAGGGEELGARGDVSFTLAWRHDTDRQGPNRKGGPDIDIWVLDPLGQRINTSNAPPIRTGPTPQGGRADRDDRGGYGAGDGGGPERIFWPENRSPSGTYTYGLRWYQGEGTVRYVLKVYLGEELVDTKTGRLTSGDIGKNIELGSVIQDD